MTLYDSMVDDDDYEGEYYQVKPSQKKTPSRYPEPKPYVAEPFNRLSEVQVRFLAKITRLKISGQMSEDEWKAIWNRISKRAALKT